MVIVATSLGGGRVPVLHEAASGSREVSSSNYSIAVCVGRVRASSSKKGAFLHPGDSMAWVNQHLVACQAVLLETELC
jgi:hypothetical protein